MHSGQWAVDTSAWALFRLFLFPNVSFLSCTESHTLASPAPAVARQLRRRHCLPAQRWLGQHGGARATGYEVQGTWAIPGLLPSVSGHLKFRFRYPSDCLGKQAVGRLFSCLLAKQKTSNPPWLGISSPSSLTSLHSRDEEERI